MNEVEGVVPDKILYLHKLSILMPAWGFICFIPWMIGRHPDDLHFVFNFFVILAHWVIAYGALKCFWLLGQIIDAYVDGPIAFRQGMFRFGINFVPVLAIIIASFFGLWDFLYFQEVGEIWERLIINLFL